jgi:hypothetical protein
MFGMMNPQIIEHQKDLARRPFNQSNLKFQKALAIDTHFDEPYLPLKTSKKPVN